MSLHKIMSTCSLPIPTYSHPAVPSLYLLTVVKCMIYSLLFRSHFSQVRHFIILFITTTNEQSSTTMSIHPLLQAQPTCRIVHSKRRGERSGNSGQVHHLDANQHRGQQGRHEALENSRQYPHVQPMRCHNQNPTTQPRMESEAQHLYRPLQVQTGIPMD
jgi:hypothetical protein